jgi:hypothetical protein
MHETKCGAGAEAPEHLSARSSEPMARSGVAFHAQRQPEGPALILGDRKLRYRQLVERTTLLRSL